MDWLRQRKEQFFVFFQPVLREGANRLSYFNYVRTHIPPADIFRVLCDVLAIAIGVVMFVLDTWHDLHVPVLFFLTSLSFGFTLAKDIMDGVPKIDEKAFYMENIKDIYQDVRPPSLPCDMAPGSEPWRRRVIRIMQDGDLLEEATIYTNDTIDRWLYENQDRIEMEEDKAYEKEIERRIKRNFKSVYHPFLRLNYRISLFYGRQFTNQKKWGVSREFYPKAGETTPVIRVHKTCYFDNYLTNIIPGRRLRSSRNEDAVIEVTGPRFLPYRVNENGERQLSHIGTLPGGSETGVTTLCFLPEEGCIPLWRQNHQAQSSRGQIVASGSGSADWKDCAQFLKDGRGKFADAVIYGMERELYEEAVGTRTISKQEFRDTTQTRIIGHFRWLQKSAEAEFLGITRTEMKYMLDKISPEESEVTEGTFLKFKTVYELKEKLEKLVQPEDPADPDCEIFISRECSISCSAAILALRNFCQYHVCDHCDCRGASCTAANCSKDPSQVLFEDAPAP